MHCQIILSIGIAGMIFAAYIYYRIYKMVCRLIDHPAIVIKISKQDNAMMVHYLYTYNNREYISCGICGDIGLNETISIKIDPVKPSRSFYGESTHYMYVYLLIFLSSVILIAVGIIGIIGSDLTSR
jgi:glyoxylate carboligase